MLLLLSYVLYTVQAFWAEGQYGSGAHVALTSCLDHCVSTVWKFTTFCRRIDEMDATFLDLGSMIGDIKGTEVSWGFLCNKNK